MCGHSGIIFYPADYLEENVFVTLQNIQDHRGPDDKGFSIISEHRELYTYYNPNKRISAAFFHNRLSIIDLSEGARQPMYSQDGRFLIIYNGEIYNYIELRKELEMLGANFRTTSDTEVLLNSYVQWGKHCLIKLIGMFSFAILDISSGNLFMARDFFGIKPFYFTQFDRGFAFASEVKTLLEINGVSRRVDPARVYSYLRFGITDNSNKTFFKDIKQLPAAHFAEINIYSKGETALERYWKPETSARSNLTFHEAANRLREIFLGSIDLHLRSDVPVGAALSGGIDSSAIVMTMRSLNKDQEIHTFSYIADDEKCDEEKYVDIVGKASKAIVHKVRPDAKEFEKDLGRLIIEQGEPFKSTSIYAQYRVFQLARENTIKVLLDGQGGDEIFGGYDIFFAARIASLLHEGKISKAINLLRHASRRGDARVGRMLIETAAFCFSGLAKAGCDLFLERCTLPVWMNREWFLERSVRGSVPYLLSGKNSLGYLLIDSLVDKTLPQLLRYEDRNSMSFSIESRVPFLTPELVSFAFSLPEDFLISDRGERKSILISALKGVVPEEILLRRDKIGFATPEKDWLISIAGSIDSIIEDGKSIKSLPIDVKVLRKSWRILKNKNIGATNILWRCINLILWSKQFSARYL